MENEKIKAFKCECYGVQLKSKLEAQVLTAFKLLNAEIKYEPQLFHLGLDLFYKPDFKVFNNSAFEDPYKRIMSNGEKVYGDYGFYSGEIGPKEFWIEVKGQFGYYQENNEQKPLILCGRESGVFYDEFGDGLACRSVNEPFLIIDEMPSGWYLDNTENLKTFFKEKFQKKAKGAKYFKPWSFDWLQTIADFSGYEFDFFDNKYVFPNTDGEHFYLSTATNQPIDWSKTLSAYLEADKLYGYNQKEL